MTELGFLNALRGATATFRTNGADPVHSVEQAHGLCMDVAILLRMEIRKRPTAASLKERRRLVRALDNAVVRYQRRLVLLAVREGGRKG